MKSPCKPFGCFVAAALSLGCGGSTEKATPTGTLKGTLTFLNEPAPPKTGLMFQHVDTGKIFFAQTGAGGGFAVETPTSALPVGKYDVSVQPAAEEDSGRKAAENALGDGPGERPAKAADRIPLKYRNAHESGLSFDLQAGPNERPINLEKGPPARLNR